MNVQTSPDQTGQLEIGDRVRLPRCRCECGEPLEPIGTVIDAADGDDGTFFLVEVLTSASPMKKVFAEGELVRGDVSVIAYHDTDAATAWPQIRGGAA